MPTCSAFSLFDFLRVVQHTENRCLVFTLMVLRPLSPQSSLSRFHRRTSSCGRSVSVYCSSWIALSLSLVGCGVIKEKPKAQHDELSAVSQPMSSKQAKQVLGEVGGNFAYGPGLGDAAVNLGAVVVFPPYILYLLGNTALSLTGYEPVTVSSLLPEEQGKAWSNGYDTVVSGPGRVVAAAAGREYRSREVGEERLREVLAKGDSTQDRAHMKGK